MSEQKEQFKNSELKISKIEREKGIIR